jgi:UDP-2,3-diacylglucosamine pyrophosphatase LpxH
MNIESLEINLLKASEIKDNDVVIVKINEFEKANLDTDKIQNLYKKITDMIKKEVPIYFFPSNFTFEIIKNAIETQNNLTKEKQEETV